MLTLPAVGDRLPGGLVVSKVVSLRKKIAGAVWDYLYIMTGSSGKFVMFTKETGDHTQLIPVPPNVRI